MTLKITKSNYTKESDKKVRGQLERAMIKESIPINQLVQKET